MNHFFQYLQGHWCFYRKIEPHGHAQGVAEFTPIPHEKNSLYYQEKGQFFQNDQKHFKMQRDYIYVCEEDTLYIYHARSGIQGDFFLKLVFESDKSSAQAQHLCQKDLYQATFCGMSAQEFSIDYQVQGPQKNYHIHTKYQKMEYI